MESPGRTWRRLLFWARQRRLAEELRQEMEAHRQLRQDACERMGMRDAADASRRALGNLTLAREEARDVWVWPRLDGIWRDIRYALTAMRRQPGFAVTSIVTIAVGTGALASVLSVAHTVLLRPAPYPNANRIVQISQLANGRDRSEVSIADLIALREGATSFARVSFAWFSEASLAGDGLPERARRVYTDAHAFELLGTQPLLGRLPTLGDESAAADPVVVIGYRLWTERFAGDSGVIGRTVRVDGRPHTVIAVMPPDFRFPAPYWSSGDLWALRPAADPAWPRSRTRNVLGFGLLKRDGDIRQAQVEADAIAARLDELHAGDGRIGLRVARWAESVRASARPRLRLLAGAACLVFVIVCVNIANLLLSRGLDRRRELAARVALGAGTARLVRQLLTETGVLFLIGGGLGVAAAVWGSRLIVALRSYDIPRMEEATIDGAVAATAMAINLAAAAIVGLVPALQAGTARMADLTGSGVRGASLGLGWRRVQRALVAAEIAVALLLICGAAMLLDGTRQLANVDAGFPAGGLVHARVSLPPEKYSALPQQIAFYERVLTNLSGIPGVTAAGVTNMPPGVGGGERPSILLAGEPVPRSIEGLRRANVRVVSAEYLDGLGLAPRGGRFFAATDTAGARVAVVNEAFVRQHLAGGQPIGALIRIAFGDVSALDRAPRTIVGIAPDIKEKRLYEASPPTVYIPLAQGDWRVSLRTALVVRSQRTVADLTAAIRGAIAAVDPEQAAYAVMPLEDLMESELSLSRLNLFLLGALATIAVVLAVIGVYGVAAHAVGQRTREIGIRLALGVSPRGVVRLLIRDSAAVLAIGMGCGAAATMWSAGLLRSIVPGIARTDALTFGAAALLLAAAVLAGCYLPARRAARIDPAIVLRMD